MTQHSEHLLGKRGDPSSDPRLPNKLAMVLPCAAVTQGYVEETGQSLDSLAANLDEKYGLHVLERDSASKE